jgi:hypothetical protein
MVITTYAAQKALVSSDVALPHSTDRALSVLV